ncbi:hypothetical protein J7K99_02325 [bacterium]|nr:hypothetical protein [bacterium]
MRKSAVVLSLIFVVFVVFGQIPRIMNYQGKLTNASGVALNGTYSIDFRIYDAATGGNLLWHQTQSVNVVNGLFDVQLDLSINGGDTLSFARPYWITLQVGSDGEMSPREKLAPVGFSFRAIWADSAEHALSDNDWQYSSGSGVTGNIYHTGNVGIGTSSPSYKLDVSGSVRLNGTVDFNKNQAVNFRIENRTSEPSSPSVGQIWIRTDL